MPSCRTFFFIAIIVISSLFSDSVVSAQLSAIEFQWVFDVQDDFDVNVNALVIIRLVGQR
jgi:hypothetical protein